MGDEELNPKPAGKVFNEATGTWEWASEAPLIQDASLGLSVRERVEADRAKTQAIRAEQQADPEGPGLVERVQEYTEPKFEHDSPSTYPPNYPDSHEPTPVESLLTEDDLAVIAEEEAHGASVSEAGNMAVFGTGATRNRKENELRYDGFLSPLALQMFARYMHKNRKTADGTIREPDNWQKGMPDASYLDSLLRHVMDIWLIYRGFPEAAREGKFESLSGAFFNIQGLMHNWMTEDVSLAEVIATLAATGTLETPDGNA
jgi:hypothetical protein